VEGLGGGGGLADEFVREGLVGELVEEGEVGGDEVSFGWEVLVAQVFVDGLGGGVELEGEDERGQGGAFYILMMPGVGGWVKSVARDVRVLGVEECGRRSNLGSVTLGVGIVGDVGRWV
jgi:hypothetical protein